MGNLINVDFINKELIDENNNSKKWSLVRKNPFFKGAVTMLCVAIGLTAAISYKGDADEKVTDTTNTTSIVSETKEYNPSYNVQDISVILLIGDEKYKGLVENIDTSLNNLGIYTQTANSDEKALELSKLNDENYTKDILVIGVGGFENNDEKAIVLSNMSDSLNGQARPNNSSSLALCLALGKYSPYMGESPVRSGYYSASAGHRKSTSLETSFAKEKDNFTNRVKTVSIAIPSKNYNEDNIYNMVVNGTLKYSSLTDEEKDANYFLTAGSGNVKSNSKQFGTDDTAADFQDTVYVGSSDILNNLKIPVDLQNIIASNTK